MEAIENVYFTNLPLSPYVKPFRLHFTQAGKTKTWDLVESRDSVIIVIINITRRVVVLVKQFRPAVYFNALHPDDRYKAVDTAKYPGSLGVTLEPCGGTVPHGKPVEQTAHDLILEVCGYDVPCKALKIITSYRVGVGVSGSLQTLVFCEVTDEMKVRSGGSKGAGGTHVIVEVVEQTLAQLERYLASSADAPLPSPPTALFALMWFLHNRADRYRKTYERTCGECKK